MVSDGLPGILNITSIDQQGRLDGSISFYPNDIPIHIYGYYDVTSGKMTFIRIVNSNFSDVEVYSGYTFSNINRDCLTGTGAGSCYQYTEVAGTFQSFLENRT